MSDLMHNHLAGLKTKRASLTSQAATIETAFAKLREAETREAELQRTLDKLGADEVQAMTLWAKDGGMGEAPALDTAERQRLAGELARAKVQADAARAASKAMEAEQVTTANDLASTHDEITEAALHVLEALHAREMANLVALVRETITPRMARGLALRALLVERAERAQASGHIDAARGYFLRADRVSHVASPIDAEPMPADILAKVPLWQQRLDEVLADAPSRHAQRPVIA